MKPKKKNKNPTLHTHTLRGESQFFLLGTLLINEHANPRFNVIETKNELNTQMAL